MTELIHEVRNYAGGKWHSPTGDETAEVWNPATGDVIATTEVFGPVLGITRVDDLEEALSLINGGRYGNMACLFTNDGQAARRFRYEAQVGNVGINVGVAQPMSSFPFSGWGDSFFGDFHAPGHQAIEFFTQTNLVVERWP